MKQIIVATLGKKGRHPGRLVEVVAIKAQYKTDCNGRWIVSTQGNLDDKQWWVISICYWLKNIFRVLHSFSSEYKGKYD